MFFLFELLSHKSPNNPTLMSVDQFIPMLGERIVHQTTLKNKNRMKETIAFLNEIVAFRNKEKWPYVVTKETIDQRLVDYNVYEFCKHHNKFTMHFANVDFTKIKELQLFALYLLQINTSTMSDELLREGMVFRLDFTNFIMKTNMINKKDALRGIGVIRHFPLKIKHFELINCPPQIKFAVKTYIMFNKNKKVKKVIFI